ncbi:hypothetical protein AB1N83_008660 [Pleurotus pulmonarius]
MYPELGGHWENEGMTGRIESCSLSVHFAVFRFSWTHIATMQHFSRRTFPADERQLSSRSLLVQSYTRSSDSCAELGVFRE